MSTLLKIGPADRGRAISYEEFVASDFMRGYQYELIEGKLQVTPAPDPSHDFSDLYLLSTLLAYSKKRPDIASHVTNQARVIVPKKNRSTNPEPDIAVYRTFDRKKSWAVNVPFIVAEVASHGNSSKDFVRNVALYRRVPSILEYWVYFEDDLAEDWALRVHRREKAGEQWTLLDFSASDTYKTPLLPGFKLPVTPSKP